MADRVMSDKGLAFMADLPPYYAEEPYVYGVQDVLAREFQRIEDFANDLLLQGFPQNADDSYGMLSEWEALVGLPAYTEALTDDQRRTRVLAHLQKRNSSAGLDWEGAVSEYLGTNDWTYAENTPGSYSIEVTIPFASGSYRFTSVETFLRQITPAHIDVVVVHGGGFIVGVDEVGEEAV